VSTRVRFEDEAEAEYRDAARWYESQRAGLGIRFLESVDTAIHRILDFPDTGATVARVPAGLPVRRMPVRRFPYHVVYLFMSDELRVLSIAHDRRKPGYWRQRVP
jgi:plasmid stabilization system protein ParE